MAGRLGIKTKYLQIQNKDWSVKQFTHTELFSNFATLISLYGN
jgi:hypothetical protein